MPFVKRGPEGEIIAVARSSEGDCSEEIAAGDPAMVQFLESLQPEVVNSLRDSDLGFIRVLEDVVDLLVEQQVIQLGDLPQDAQDKITQRKQLRSLLQHQDLRRSS